MYRFLLKIIPDNFSINHVHEDQDYYKFYNELDLRASLNINSEQLATTISKQTMSIRIILYSFSI